MAKTDPMIQAQKLANSASIQVQKLANQSAEKLQKLTKEANKETFAYNSAEAQKNRNWEKMMSDTSHQREVADLKKAGLNPVLSVNQGAQSYTSASASGQAESGANAVSGVYGSSLGAMSQIASSQFNSAAQIKSSRTAAAASLKAARAQAAAMRESAAASAAAQRYAADRNYAAQKYAWDKKEAMQKYEYTHKPAGNAWTLADKYLSRIGVDASVVRGVKSILKDIKNASLVSVYNNSNDFKLSKVGYNKMNQACTQLGIAQNKNNRYLVYKAINGNKSAINTLKYLTRYPGYKHNSKHQR